MPVNPHPKIVLIGGPSHAGKSTLCDALGALPGWSKQSTDMLGSHPGRPWKPAGERVRPHVVEHYLSLSPDELLADILGFQRRMWPTIERIIEDQHRAPGGALNLAFQGSALLPEYTGGLASDRVTPLCLSASPEFLEARIRRNSSYAALSGTARTLVDKFMARNRLMNDLYVRMARENGVRVIDVGIGVSVRELVEIATGDRCEPLREFRS